MRRSMVPGGHRSGRFSAALGSVRSAGGRMSWGLLDQAISSLTNFGVGIVVARSFGLEEFGSFTLAWFTYGLIVNISRGLGTDPLVVRFSHAPVALWRTAVSRTSATALVVGVVMGALCLVTGILVPGPVGDALAGLGVVLPALMLQDSWRFAFFASGAGWKACLNDLVWGVSLIGALLVAVQRGTLFGLMIAWGLAAGVAAVFGFWQARIRPSFRGVPVWLREQRELGFRYLVENITQSGGNQLRMYALGAIGGLVEVAALRGAQLLLGPLLAVLMGIGVVAVPEGVRWLRRSTRSLVRFCLALGAIEASIALVWGVGLFLMPDEVGAALLGDVWAPASVLIVPMALSVVTSSFTTGATTGLRSLGAARLSLRSQLVETTLLLLATVIGAAVAGALGATWAGLGAVLVASVVWWSLFRHALRAGYGSQVARGVEEETGSVTAQ